MKCSSALLSWELTEDLIFWKLLKAERKMGELMDLVVSHFTEGKHSVAYSIFGRASRGGKVLVTNGANVNAQSQVNLYISDAKKCCDYDSQ